MCVCLFLGGREVCEAAADVFEAFFNGVCLVEALFGALVNGLGSGLCFCGGGNAS